MTTKCVLFSKLLQNTRNVNKKVGGELVTEVVLELLREGQDKLSKVSVECLGCLGLEGLEEHLKGFQRL